MYKEQELGFQPERLQSLCSYPRGSLALPGLTLGAQGKLARMLTE